MLPAGFVLGGLTRSGTASLATRLSLFELLLRGVGHPGAWADDPWRTLASATGLAAGAAAVVTAPAAIPVAEASVRHGSSAQALG